MKDYCVFFWTVTNNIKSREAYQADTKREAIEIAEKNMNVANGSIHVRKLNKNKDMYETEIVFI
jgi:hypothetical protein